MGVASAAHCQQQHGGGSFASCQGNADHRGSGWCQGRHRLSVAPKGVVFGTGSSQAHMCTAATDHEPGGTPISLAGVKVCALLLPSSLHGRTAAVKQAHDEL